MAYHFNVKLLMLLNILSFVQFLIRCGWFSRNSASWAYRPPYTLADYIFHPLEDYQYIKIFNVEMGIFKVCVVLFVIIVV